MLSLVTVAHGPRSHLAALLEGASRMRPRPFEAVVVHPGGPPVRGPDDLPVRIVPLPLPEASGADAGVLPMAAARNTGAAAARGTLLLFLDPDCVPATDLAGQLRTALARRGGLVMADVRRASGGARESGPGPGPGAGPDPGASARDRHVDPRLFRATAFGVRRRVFEGLGGFCEAYVGHGVEDADLGLTAAAAGVGVSRWCLARAHPQAHSTADPPVERLRSIVLDARTFHQRWGRWPREEWLAALAERGLVEWEPDAGVLRLTTDRLTPA